MKGAVEPYKKRPQTGILSPKKKEKKGRRSETGGKFLAVSNYEVFKERAVPIKETWV